MVLSNRQNASIYLHNLVGQPLLYALKSPDTELYDFGFGKLIKRENRHEKAKMIGTHTLHILCRFKVIWKNGESRVDEYYEDTQAEWFCTEIQHLIGLTVKRVALSDKNDLWIDLGDFWIVFATFEDGEESWRYFTADREKPHLVASDSIIDFS